VKKKTDIMRDGIINNAFCRAHVSVGREARDATVRCARRVFVRSFTVAEEGNRRARVFARYSPPLR